MAKHLSRPKRWAKWNGEFSTCLSELETTVEEITDAIPSTDDDDDSDGTVEVTGELASLLAQWTGIVGRAQDALAEVEAVKDEYRDWFDNMPDSLQSGPTGDLLSALVDIDTDFPDVPTPEPEAGERIAADITEDMRSAIDELQDIADALESAEFPRGFGRD